MFVQVNKWVLSYYIIIALTTSVVLTYLLTDKQEYTAWFTVIKAKFWMLIGKPEKMISVATQYGDTVVSLPQILTSPFYLHYYEAFNYSIVWGAVTSFAAWTTLFIFVFMMLNKKGKNLQDETLVRGTTVESVKDVNKLLISQSRASRLTIAGLHLVLDSEVKHIGFHGTTSTGKTQAYIALLKQIRARGERAIVFDDGGEFTSRFYDPEKGDIILNPFDARCANWLMWDECQTDADYENLAAAMIPEESDKDKFWMYSTRTLFADLCRQHGESENPKYEDLLKSCLSISLEKLQEFLKDRPAEQLVDKSIAKTAMTIRAVITNHVKSLRYLPDDPDKKSFSIRDWVVNEEENRGACIFLVTRDKDHESIRSLISLWIGLVSTHIKSLPRSRTRRIWGLYDEVTKLNRLPSLPDTLATGRNYGLCMVLGFQNRAQLRMVYGRDTSDAIIDLLSTQFYFRSPSHMIADEVSKELGESEVIEKITQYAFGPKEVKDGQSLNQTKRIKRVVSYTEIQMMDDLEAYVKLPANIPRCKIKLPTPKKVVLSQEPFIERLIKLDPFVEQSLQLAEQEHNPTPKASFITESCVTNTAQILSKFTPKSTTNNTNSTSNQSEGREKEIPTTMDKPQEVVRQQDSKEDKEAEKQRATDERLILDEEAMPPQEALEGHEEYEKGVDF